MLVLNCFLIIKYNLCLVQEQLFVSQKLVYLKICVGKGDFQAHVDQICKSSSGGNKIITMIYLSLEKVR